MKKIVCITGTRPQLIKHAVLSKALHKQFCIESLNSGQHYNYELYGLLKKELLPELEFHEMEVEHTQSPAIRLGEMIQKIAAFLQDAKPDAVLVYGDTDTTLAGALAAHKMNLKLVHIEAGERSFNRSMPEEHNRVVTDALADVLFCASHTAVAQIQKERPNATVVYSGDLMKDLLLQTEAVFQKPILTEPYIFCTIHRNYTNQNQAKLEELLIAMAELDYDIVFPVHPATQLIINSLTREKDHFSNIKFLPPVSYSESIHFQKFAESVITDSGGIQKEAYWMKRRCLTIRKETEWVSTLQGNWNQLAYENLSEIKVLLQAPLGTHDPELYGDGHAAEAIAHTLNQLI